MDLFGFKIKPQDVASVIQTGLQLGSQVLGSREKEKQQEEQQAIAQQQAAITNEEARRQFDEMLKYRYAALAQSGAGGGGGMDPRDLALKQQQLKLQQKQLAEEVKYNQAILAQKQKEALQQAFVQKMQIQANQETARSQGLRDLIQAYQGAYANR